MILEQNQNKELIMRKMFAVLVLVGATSSLFGWSYSYSSSSNWHYENDGCAKVTPYSIDLSECIDESPRSILAKAGKRGICLTLGWCF